MNELHQEFFEKVKTFGKPGIGEDGKPTKFYPTIKPNRDSTAWLMWMVYFSELDMAATVSEMSKRWGSDASSWTVQTIDPTKFQPGWPVYSSQIEGMRTKLDGIIQGDETSRKAFVEKFMKTMRAASTTKHARHDAKTKAAADALADYKALELSDKDREMQDRIIKAALDGRAKK